MLRPAPARQYVDTARFASLGSSAPAGRGTTNTAMVAPMIHVRALMIRSEVVLDSELD